MDETKTKQTPDGTHTTVNRTVSQPSGGNGTMWFLMGGVIVLVAIIAYFVMGDGTLPTTSASEPAGGNVSINVDTNDAVAPPAETAPAETAPAETAPVEAEPAPAD